MLTDYLRDPATVPDDWRRYFDRLAADGEIDTGFRSDPSFRSSGFFAGNGSGTAASGTAATSNVADTELQHRVDGLIRNYRMRGHMAAHLDPLDLPRPLPPDLELSKLGIRDTELDQAVSTVSVPGPDVQTVRQILTRLRNTYCRYIGVEFMHIDDLYVREWLQARMEASENRLALSHDEQLRILRWLTDAVVFEDFIQKTYLGAKSFSLEGCESLIPLLDLAIEKAGAQGVREIILGMAHRGRLNVLANILGKEPREIFREFEDTDPEHYYGRGDVKYHLGYSSDWQTASGQTVHLSLSFNPSHLEFINPVALGRTRAKQDRFGDTTHRQALTLLIHGDAAFAGEGIVQETLNLSQLPAYTVGGTLHVVVNNQIGFTTSPSQSRSSAYATDIAKMLQSPIFHVNGEDPEAVAQTVHVAMEFRQFFQRDVVIDMYCFRRRGHNEGDEPAFTQPLLYQTIRKRQPVRVSYLEHLLRLGGITREEAEALIEEERASLEEALVIARDEATKKSEPQAYSGLWHGYRGGRDRDVAEIETGVATARLSQLLAGLTELPADFHPHRTIRRGLDARREMAEGQRPLDWAAGEALAFATLAADGVRIRMSGQDCERGTFSQRHAVLHDVEDGHTYVPLQHVAPSQGPVEIVNSPLSEAGVLGFEYGYSLDCPDGLVVWEAQFGDFVNAAQVVIDQFMASAEDKWHRLSGITLLLPHGFEGQGPEHSSARVERWLTLAAEDNFQLVYPTTPAQYFQVLRRQVLRPIRKPLIVLTPKSLLRNPTVVSDLDALASGTFHRVIPEARVAGAVERVLLCSGKIYYDLEQYGREHGRDDVAIVRLEQLYPTPLETLRTTLADVADGTDVIWVQEEPRNMGAWPYLSTLLGESLFDRLPLTSIARAASASTATGSASSHRIEQQELITHAFEGESDAGSPSHDT